MMIRLQSLTTMRIGKWTLQGLGILAVAVVAAAQPAQEKVKTDVNGDDSPAGTVARMGSLRWRHGSAITFVACTPDGKTVVTATQDGMVRSWDRETGKEIRKFEGKVGQGMIPRGGGMIGWAGVYPGATRVSLSADGKTLAAAILPNDIQLWNVETGKEIKKFTGPAVGMTSVMLSPDGKVVATRSFDRTTYLFSAETGKEIQKIKAKQVNMRGFIIGPNGAGADGAFSPDGKTLVTADADFNMQKQDACLRFSETGTGKEIRKIDANPDGVSALSFAADGKALAYAVGNNIHVCEPDTGKEIRKIDNESGIAEVAFSPDGKLIASRGRDTIIRVWDANTGKMLHQIGEAVANGNGNVVIAIYAQSNRDITFSHDSKTLVVGGASALRFYDVGTGKEKAANCGGHRGAVTAMALSADGKTMVTRGDDGVVRKWEAATGKEIGQFAEPKGTSGAMFSPDAKTVAFALVDGKILLHSTDNGKKQHELKGHQGGVATITFSVDSKILASRGSSDNAVHLYDVARGGEMKQLALPNRNDGGNGGFIVVGFGGPAGLALAISPDGQSVAANVNSFANMVFQPGGEGLNDGTGVIHQWDIATGKPLRKLTYPGSRQIFGLAYSTDNRLLATENHDHTISLFELASGKERASLGRAVAGQPPLGTFTVVGNGMGVRTPLSTISLAFSRDGALLASRGNGNTVRLFETSQGKEIQSLKGHQGAVNAAVFTADGKLLATASADTTCLVWDLAIVKRTPKGEMVKLGADELDTLWTDLKGDDGAKASNGISRLSLGAKDAAPWLSEKLKPAAAPNVEKIDGWITDLNSVNFQKRTIASSELERLGELAIPALKKAIANPPSVEARRRMEPILEKLTTGTLTPDQIRVVRAVEALERMGTSDARTLLESLAGGAPGALPTRQAQAALDRMGKN